MTQILRTFHPVGQGAFYTETHRDCYTQNQINIVYDCGTKTKEINIENVIHKAFFQNTIIDILFISHFDEDHISGIYELKNRCTIKKVVIPLIPQEDRLLFIITNEISSPYKEIITNPESYFGENTQITYVISTDQEAQENNIRDYNRNIIKSGDHIDITGHSKTWCYIPFNFKYTKRLDELKKVLKEKKLEIDKLTNIEYIKSKEKIIREAYRKITSSINRNSLIVYSGPKNISLKTKNISSSILVHKGHKTKLHDCKSCLYLGDSRIQDSKKKKDRTFPLLLELEKRLKTEYYNTIRMIQIPHHGSEKDFDKVILDNPPKYLSIISCGTNNTYKHPSPSVVKEITLSNSMLCIITEIPNSKCTIISCY